MARLIRHEKPLPKAEEHGNNPNEIIINQHVIPNKHLSEWSTDGKMVEVFDIENNKFKVLPTKSSYFCVMRLWDQWTESKMLKSNEANYQSQIGLMKNGKGFTKTDYVIAYYVLLCVRVWVANKERPHYTSIFSSISPEYNQSELEDNELEMEDNELEMEDNELEMEDNELEMDGSAHIINSTIDTDSQHMSRQVVKMEMNQVFSRWCYGIKMQKWKVYQSDGGNFILSDAFYVNFIEGFHVLPMNPKQVLIAESTYEHLEKSGSLSVQYINSVMKKNAVNYYIKTSDSNDS